MKKKRTNHAPFAKYLAICFVGLKELLYYPQRFYATLLIVPFRIIVLIYIYTYAFSYIDKSIHGINASIAIWSIAIYHMLLCVQFRGIFKTITDEIRRGDLEVQINKPYSYLFFKFWEHLGKGLPNFFLCLLIIVPLLLLTIGIPDVHFSLPRILGVLCLVITGTGVSALLYILIALPVLWIDDAQPFFWILDKSILVLGGAYVPLALLPQSFQTFASITPFGAPMFATQMFNPDFLEKWPFLFAMQLFWLFIGVLLIAGIFVKAKANLSINGG